MVVFETTKNVTFQNSLKLYRKDSLRRESDRWCTIGHLGTIEKSSNLYCNNFKYNSNSKQWVGIDDDCLNYWNNGTFLLTLSMHVPTPNKQTRTLTLIQRLIVTLTGTLTLITLTLTLHEQSLIPLNAEAPLGSISCDNDNRQLFVNYSWGNSFFEVPLSSHPHPSLSNCCLSHTLFIERLPPS